MKTKFIFLIIFLFSVIGIEARDITGTVISNYDGEPVPGATIIVKGTTLATISDINGKFILKNIPETAKFLEVSFVDMVTQTVEITDKNDYIIYLEKSDVELEEVVVTGLGISRDEKKLGYSVSDDGSSRRDRKDASVSYEYSYDDAPSGSTVNNQIKSGMLTAGEVNDFGKWEMWGDITQTDLHSYRSVWKIYPLERYCVLLTSPENKPIIDATVYLKSNGKTIWTAKTDNTGKAELWDNMFDSTDNKKISIQVDYKGVLNSIDNPTKFHNGINRMTISEDCNIPNNVEIAFVVDATGSMGDEMYYLQTEILDVMNRVDSSYKNLNTRLASVFYRDIGDSYVTKFSDFNSDINKSVEFFKQQTAGGGGDFPEAVDSALFVAINKLSWSSDARTRIIFLVLDAPPHSESNVVKNLQELTKLAASKGIRIVPVTCSGIDKSTEYLMRSMALATNGTYVFLTDDSGIGGSHIKPTTDKWDVEFLNDLLVRVIKQYIFTPDCQNKIVYEQKDIENDTVEINLTDNLQDTSFVVSNDTIQNNPDTVSTNNPDVDNDKIQSLKIYPNPTSGPVTVEISGKIKEFYLCDFSGKILQRELVKDENIIQLDISMYPPGFYFIRYFVGETLQSGKIVLIY